VTKNTVFDANFYPLRKTDTSGEESPWVLKPLDRLVRDAAILAVHRRRLSEVYPQLTANGQLGLVHLRRELLP
jgi:hypothetical protein